MRFAQSVLILLLLSATLLADDGPVLFSDNFANLDPGWGDESPNKSASGNKLVLKPDANSGFSTIHRGNLFKDADIRVKVQETGGGTDETAGIAFWAADTDNYYLAQMQPEGLVGISRIMGDRALTPLGYAASDALNNGLGKVNELRVVTLGKSATFYVNGKQIGTIKGFPPELGGRIGLHAESGNTVYTWAFSDFEVRQPTGKAPASAADASLLFDDDFSTLDPAWGTADGEQSVANGSLYFQAAVGTSYTSLYQGTLFNDFDFRVKISTVSGGTDQPVGVVFWASDYKNLYTAQIRGDGSAGISQLKDGQWQGLTGFDVRDAVAKGVGQTNELRIVAKGKQATFYVNGQQIATLEGSPPQGGSKIGLRAVSGNTAVYTYQFSGFSVRKP